MSRCFPSGTLVEAVCRTTPTPNPAEIDAHVAESPVRTKDIIRVDNSADRGPNFDWGAVQEARVAAVGGEIDSKAACTIIEYKNIS